MCAPVESGLVVNISRLLWLRIDSDPRHVNSYEHASNDGAAMRKLKDALAGSSPFHLGARLIFLFVVLSSLILGGNLLLIWQFHLARLQSDRLTGESQQLIAILRLQEALRSFHQRLDELVQQQDDAHLRVGVGAIRSALIDDVQRTKGAITRLPPGARIDPAFMPTLEGIEITLPSQLEAITSLAGTGDWKAVRRRLSSEMRPLEFQISALVRSIDDEVSAEVSRARTNMEDVQQRIFIIVPTTAVATFLFSGFFAWAITRHIAHLRTEERLNERTRIARELHDTLLQGFISASIQLHVVGEEIPKDSSARPLFDRVVQLIAQVIEEGRAAVRGFRSIDMDEEKLERSFAKIQQELGLESSFDFKVIVEGQPLILRPQTRDEVYAIGREALINAYRHSRANAIEVRLEYSSDQFRVVVRDDGIGIDDEVLQSGREGHWGLSGMQERAERIGGTLKLWSPKQAGTEVELLIPGRIAFQRGGWQG